MTHYIYILIILPLIACIIWRYYSSHYTAPCPAWLSWMIECDNPFAKAHKAKAIIDALPLQNEIQILDIGCGPGRVLLPLAQKIAPLNGQVTGLDIQADMIKKTSKKAKQRNINNIAFIHGNIDTIPIDKNYHIILMNCVLGEIPKNAHIPVIQKIEQHLEENGIVSITETIFDPHFQRHKTVLAFMGKMGFIQTHFIGNFFAYTAHFKKIKNK